ncbi:MAG: UbiD family decarboxylase [Acidobacteria bacterium]|nr:UbiD family decarboxylase [Acidobacteriota bacterium]
MEEMAVSPASPAAHIEETEMSLLEGQGPRDLREYCRQLEELGELHRIQAEVDWDMEMAALVYVAHRKVGAPALLFENVRGYKTPVLWNSLGSSVRRFATAMGIPRDIDLKTLIRAAGVRLKRPVPPKKVSAGDAPVFENSMVGDAVDLWRFPVPRHWPLDGGRYIGTADAVITRDPEKGHLNVGTYRMMVHDKNHVGLYLSPGKDARLHIDGWWQQGKPCEVAAVWGVEPALFMVSGLTLPKTESEFPYSGGLKGAPIELVDGKATGLMIPARAEIVMEGITHPGSTRMEGPFGEFTGYYGRPEDLAPLVEVKAVHFRNRPITTAALMADYWASNECGLLYAVMRSARVWDDLDRLGVPGIKGVYAHPAAAGGFGMTVVSMQQRYAGHAPQVLALVAQCPAGAYYSKWIVAVDEDVDPTDINEVLWAMATRCNPVEDVDILRETWSTWLDPTQNPPEKRPYGSKALVNACIEHRNLAAFSRRTRLDPKVYEKVISRWAEYGLGFDPPTVSTFETLKTRDLEPAR